MCSIHFIWVFSPDKLTVKKSSPNLTELFLRTKHTDFTLDGTETLRSPSELFMTGELHPCSNNINKLCTYIYRSIYMSTGYYIFPISNACVLKADSEPKRRMRAPF